MSKIFEMTGVDEFYPGAIIWGSVGDPVAPGASAFHATADELRYHDKATRSNMGLHFVCYRALGGWRALSYYAYNKKQRMLFKDEAAQAVPPVPVIAERVEIDHYDNQVSIALLPSGNVFRVVHHTPAIEDQPGMARQSRSTVYSGRDLSVPFIVERTVDGNTLVKVRHFVAGYDTEGQYVGAYSCDSNVRPPERLDPNRMLLTVLEELERQPDLWEQKK